MKSCQVYFKGLFAYVFTQCTTKDGLTINTAPMIKAAATDPVEIGVAVMNCLDASRDGVPSPENFGAIAKTMFKFAGEKSWKRFVTGTILRAVWVEGNRARVVPYVRAESDSFRNYPKSMT